MSKHDEKTFRVKIQHLLERWIGAVEVSLEEMVKQHQLNSTKDIKKVRKRC